VSFDPEILVNLLVLVVHIPARGTEHCFLPANESRLLYEKLSLQTSFQNFMILS